MCAIRSRPLAIEDFAELLGDFAHRLLIQPRVHDFNPRITLGRTLWGDDPTLGRRGLALPDDAEESLAHEEKHQNEPKSHLMRARLLTEPIEEVKERGIIHKHPTFGPWGRHFRLPKGNEVWRSLRSIPRVRSNLDAPQTRRGGWVINQCRNDVRAAFKLRTSHAAATERATNIPT